MLSCKLSYAILLGVPSCLPSVRIPVPTHHSLFTSGPNTLSDCRGCQRCDVVSQSGQIGAPSLLIEQLPVRGSSSSCHLKVPFACPLLCSLPASLDHLVRQAASLSMTLGDITSAVSTDPATQAIVDVGDEASKNSGFFGTIAGVFEMVLKASDFTKHPSSTTALSTAKEHPHFGVRSCLGLFASCNIV